MRCMKCKKKIIIDYKCRCENSFCLNCLPYFSHNCTYDYKENKKTILHENNPKITAVKVSLL